MLCLLVDREKIWNGKEISHNTKYTVQHHKNEMNEKRKKLNSERQMPFKFSRMKIIIFFFFISFSVTAVAIAAVILLIAFICLFKRCGILSIIWIYFLYITLVCVVSVFTQMKPIFVIPSNFSSAICTCLYFRDNCMQMKREKTRKSIKLIDTKITKTKHITLHW